MSDSLVRVSRRVGSIRDAGSWPSGTRRHKAQRAKNPRSGAQRTKTHARRRRAVACWGPKRSCLRRRASPPAKRQIDSLASNDFTYYFTFFSKFFSSFPHGTCSLSVSRKYLALEGHYLPISAAVPSNTTHCSRPLYEAFRTERGCYPLRLAISTTNCTRSQTKVHSQDTMRRGKTAELFKLSWSRFTRRY